MCLFYNLRFVNFILNENDDDDEVKLIGSFIAVYRARIVLSAIYTDAVCLFVFPSHSCTAIKRQNICG